VKLARCIVLGAPRPERVMLPAAGVEVL